MKKKNVLIAHYVPDIISGAERAILDMVLPLQEVFDFTMFVPEEGILAEYYRKEGLDVHVQPMSNKRKKFPGLHTIHALLFAKYLKKKSFDLVLCNTFFSAAKMTKPTSIANVPMAIFVREYIDYKNNKHFRHYINNAKAILGVSQDVAGYLAAAHDNVYTTHDFLDTKMISKKSILSDSLGNKGPSICLIGRVTPYKQQDLFVAAFKEVQESIPDVKFYIIGEASKKEQSFKNKLMQEAKDISENIIFLGNRSDIYELLPQFSLSCMVSDREPFPRTILEAQFLKVPVLASNTGGAKEMITDGKTGLFFEVKNKDQSMLATKIIQSLQDQKKAKEMVEKAYDKLMSTFATQAPIENFKNVLMEIMEESE